MKRSINVIVINKAGKVGKSTIAKQLISPMMGAEWIQVETFNDSGTGAKAKIAGRRFGFIAEAVAALTGSKCIDIGNSNYEAAMKEMRQIEGFADEIAFWVVPCRQSAGMMNDTISTVGELINDLGVEPARIVVIPNGIEDSEFGLDAFASVARAASRIGFHFCKAPLVEAPTFDVFNKDERSILEIAAEKVDYAALIGAEADADKREKLAAAKVLSGRARFLARNLRGVWAATPLAALTETAEA